ncbi:hypothetical protein E4P82_19660 [Candidatus Competibacter phosphatis]|uniref:Uncharacterized protein n=1 Tax=Candidatus Competibacter phosphatis TaxID=221280 RepID=A0ABX1TP36_9GAMM|nr:hypothetical protein [Candidatus Competibacter phosphatis]NMQ21218.1 hypothetical protein [Candidatus Competibacter phosphatis]
MIPQPIYEALPYLYGAGGVFAIVGLETVGGKFCGFLLITAGVIIYQARSRHRGKKSSTHQKFWAPRLEDLCLIDLPPGNHKAIFHTMNMQSTERFELRLSRPAS